MKGHKCKGRRPNGQLKKGYTLKNGRVAQESDTRNVDSSRPFTQLKSYPLT